MPDGADQESDTTTDQRRQEMVAVIERYPIYWLAHRSMKELVMMRPLNEVEQSLDSLVSVWPVAPRLRSLIHVLNRKYYDEAIYKPVGGRDVYDPLDYVEAARTQWDKRMRDQLRNVASHQKRSLVMRRAKIDNSRDQESEVPAHLLFSWTDLLSEFEKLVNPNSTGTFSSVKELHSIKVLLRTPLKSSLRETYQQLSPSIRQFGLDDELSGLEWFSNQRVAEGERLLNSFATPVRDFINYAKTGIPPSLRPRFWMRILGLWPSERDLTYYERLISQVRVWDMVTDDLYRLEVQETADNAAYFVFEDMLDEIMLAFSRDDWIPRNSIIPVSVAPLMANVGGEMENGSDEKFVSPMQADASVDVNLENSGLKVNEEGMTAVPPCHVVPFHQQVILAAPLCYLFQRPEQTYFLYRELYARYFCRLHTISSRKDTILFLSKLFEDLVQSECPQMFYHAVELGVLPIRIAFPWMFTAFAGYLSVEQVLTLWDRIVAYDSLELLAVLSAAIFVFRSKSVLNAISGDEIRDIFEDGSHFRVLPLLQHFLFDSSR